MNCQNTLNCVAFNYNKVTWNCELIGQISGNSTINAQYVTGPKMCGQFTGNMHNNKKPFINLKSTYYTTMVEHC